MDHKLSLLRAAIVTSDYEKIAEMIGQDISLVNERLSGNVTPLMLALLQENSQIADLLIRRGGKIDILTSVLMGDADAVRNSLMQRPWLIKKHSPYGNYSLLHLGARYGNPELVRLLLEHGIDPNEARQPDYLTPLFFSHRPPYKNAELLLESGAEINARGKHGQTVLHQAVMYDDPEWMKFLLRRGANPELQTRARQSPWMLAVKWKRFQAAAILEEFCISRGPQS